MASLSDHACQVVKSGRFSLHVTTQVGPRILGGFIGDSDNLFAVLPVEPIAQPVGSEFILYGGHRIWHAPEAAPRTYAPDNDPVAITDDGDGAFTFSSGVESSTGIEKSFQIKPLGNERFQLVHSLTNRNLWAIELAPWALSQMAPGGLAILPQHHAPDADPFQVDRSLHVWPYSNLADERLHIGSDFLMLAQDTAIAAPCKIGFACIDGWTAYANGSTVLVKQFAYDSSANYPDHGCNVESYTCDTFCELETLGPLVTLKPGETTTLTEEWWALDDMPELTSEEQIRTHLVPRLNA